jgi:cardiolipin synthase
MDSLLASIPDWVVDYGPPLWAAHLLALSIWIVLQKRPPLSTLSWILSMALLPVFGFVIYFFLGPQKIHRQRLRRQRLRRQHSAGARRDREARDSLPRRKRGLGDLVERAIGTPVSSVTSLDLLVGGEAKIDALLRAIAEARDHVHMEYYILEPDAVGELIRTALVDAAGRGVQVRLLVDGIGSARLGRRFLRPLRDAGVEVARFHPFRAVVLRPLLNLRTHRKIAVFDGCIGFVGGINLCDSVDARHCEVAWHDYHLRLEGQAVGWLQALFAEDWLYATRKGLPEGDLYPDCERGAVTAQVLASGPDSDSEAIHRAFVQAIHDARERVWLVTPYFVPGEAALMALSNAALRGVDVRLLLPRRSDSRLVDYAGRAYYDDLLSRGVRIWRYPLGMLHAKALLVDNDLGIVGTANFDPRSFRLNFEVALAIYDSDFVSRLAAQMSADMDASIQVRQPRNLSFLRRLGEAFAKLFSPLL